ncbi:MAG: glycosyltransferase, partial [Candidatus Electrothrix sp. LOE2]|nr:glycosyltransferase [Candidatus Electrothrix sp. LOE2]
MREEKMLDIIVPVFNEEDGLHEFYTRITALGPGYHLIFIDNTPQT